MKVAWVTSWDRQCGIAEYSKGLWDDMARALHAQGDSATVVSLDEFPSADALLRRLKELAPDLIHFQHEYSFFGGKNPPRYFFPRLVKSIRIALPSARLIATAHTVLPRDYRFPVKGRGLQIPFRMIANALMLKPLVRTWGSGTWGRLDGVIVHSKLQVETIRSAGIDQISVIPLFVPALPPEPSDSPLPPGIGVSGKFRNVVVFGFLTPEKGQDVVVEAMAHLPNDVRLILAGGLRREGDRGYQEQCQAIAKRLGVQDRVIFTGFVEDRFIPGLFQNADLVVAPFRETSGSASIVQAFARGAAVLASDLPLNLEVDQREPGMMAFFRSGDALDCARKIQALLSDEPRREALGEAALRYARSLEPPAVARQHLDFYRAVATPSRSNL
jgi:glycosyltransferase involved in cell wall biosynthesis